jgi:phosphomevalonate kinase
MKACAPGKLVLSGAYSVLEGAPALVSAVNRYVWADAAQPASIVTPEVRAALRGAPAPAFDASALRAEGRKLGLGSSAAILVASLAAAEPRQFTSEADLRQAIFGTALAAHRQAQGGGSGIDVAASTWGGTLLARCSADGGLEVEPLLLPRALVVEVWASEVAASTAEFLQAVARFRARSPAEHAALLGALRAAAERASEALRGGQTSELIAQLERQRAGFVALGRAAGIPIVTPEAEQLSSAAGTGAVVLPSGAGGGDIVLWLSDRSSPREFRDLATSLGHHLLPLTLHARGVYRCAPESTPDRGP